MDMYMYTVPTYAGTSLFKHLKHIIDRINIEHHGDEPDQSTHANRCKSEIVVAISM